MKILGIFLLFLSLNSFSANAEDGPSNSKEIAEKLTKVILRSGFSMPYEMDDRGNIIDVVTKKPGEVTDLIALNLVTNNGEVCTTSFYYHNSDAAPLAPYTACIDKDTGLAYSPEYMAMVSHWISMYIFDENDIFNKRNIHDIFDENTKSGQIFRELSEKVRKGMRVDENGYCTDINQYHWKEEPDTYCDLRMYENIVKLDKSIFRVR